MSKKYAAVIFLCLSLIASRASALTTTVSNNSELSALSVRTYSSVIRLGYATAGDSDQLTYSASTLPCSLNNGNGDGGSQVPSRNPWRFAGCWIAHFPSIGADVREWGASSANAGANANASPAVNNALRWAAANDGKLVFPAGVFSFSTAVSVKVPANSSITIEGAGADQTVLQFAPGQNGINIAVNGGFSAFHIRNLTVAAGGQPNTTPASGINLTQVALSAPILSNYPALSDITGVTFRGADGYAMKDGWTNCVYTNYVSLINFINDNFVGPQNPLLGGNGIVLAGGGTTPGGIGVLYNIVGSNFFYFNYGIYYGPNIQGVSISQSTFFGSNYGVYAPNALNTQQLSIVASEFQNFVANIYENVPATQIVGNLFYVFSQNGYGIEGLDDDIIIGNNTFVAYSSKGTTSIAITRGYTGTITGNTFSGASTAISLGANATGIRVANNLFSSNTTNIVNSNPTNTITGAPNSTALVSIIAAAGNGGSPNLTRLTVTSTAQFVTGEEVSVTGVGGVNANIIGPIAVIDGTHMDLLNDIFSGRYTGGGVVSAEP